jgi:hypothetical protein
MPRELVAHDPHDLARELRVALGIGAMHVVQDRARVLQIEARELDRELLGERIADRVGVAEPLALDDLDALVPGRTAFGADDLDAHRPTDTRPGPA